jgi:hypothetical protein
MIVNIVTKEGDDKVFITCLNSTISQIAVDRHLREVYVTRVANWFDRRWLRFSGTGRVRFDGITRDRDTALDEFRQTHLTFPPFSPRQVSLPVAWRLGPSGAYERVSKPRPFARRERGHSAANLQNRVRSFSDSGLFVWFSSSSEPNRIACVMAYSVEDENEDAWYASFRKGSSWRVAETKGIARERLLHWFPLS